MCNPFFPRAVLVAVGAALPLVSGAHAQPAQPEPDTARKQAELDARVQDLEAQNRELQRRLRSFEQREEPEPVDIRDADPASDEYRFLTLGAARDYLTQERWRLVDQIETFIPPLYEPVRPFLHAYTLPPGAFRIALGSRLTWNDSDFGRDDDHAKLFEHVDVKTQTVNLSLSYGFELPRFPDLTATLDIPYKSVQVSGSGHPFRNDAMLMTMDGSGQGLGDISLTFKKKWLDQGNAGFNLATFTGVIFPTGEDEEKFNRAQVFTVNGERMPEPPLNIFSRSPDGRLLPPALQPGQGAWGVRVGAAATRQLTRGAFHAGFIADVFTENDGIEPGNELRFGASYVFPPFGSDTVAIDLTVFGRYKQDSEFPGVGIMGPREDFKHDTVVFFSPSLILTPNPQMRFFLSPEFRILEPDTGPSPEFGISAGMVFTF